MKKVLLLLLLLSANAFAGDAHKCAMVSTVFEMASYARNDQRPPEIAYAMTASFKELEPAERKAIINTVYFNPALRNVSGPALGREVMKICLYGSKQFAPL